MVSQRIAFRSYYDLRAYRCAKRLASDVFWLTRQRTLHRSLAEQLRQTTLRIPEIVIRAWSVRHEVGEFDARLSEGIDACVQLRLIVEIAGLSGGLAEGEGEFVEGQAAELRRFMERMRAGRRPNGAEGD
jgi:hypothetical protein